MSDVMVEAEEATVGPEGEITENTGPELPFDAPPELDSEEVGAQAALIALVAERVFNEASEYVTLEKSKAEKSPSLQELAANFLDDPDVKKLNDKLTKLSADVAKVRESLRDRIKAVSGDTVSDAEKYGERRTALRKSARAGIELLKMVAVSVPEVCEWADDVESVFTRKADGSAPSVASNGDAKKVREWAAANGHKVNERGRISAKLQEAYNAAHSTEAAAS